MADHSGGATYRFVAGFVIFALDVQGSAYRHRVVRGVPVCEENVPALSSDFRKRATEGVFQVCLDHAVGVPRNGSSGARYGTIHGGPDALFEFGWQEVHVFLVALGQGKVPCIQFWEESSIPSEQWQRPH